LEGSVSISNALLPDKSSKAMQFALSARLERAKPDQETVEKEYASANARQLFARRQIYDSTAADSRLHGQQHGCE